MATGGLILNNVLTFLVHRFGKLSVNQLKSMIVDFYRSEDLIDAKKQLLHDISYVKAEINLPHIPDRREGEGRAAKVADDLITIFTCLDEKLKLSSLPKYVAEGPDVMPSARLYEGDLLTMMNMFSKLSGKVEETRSALSAIVDELRGVKQQVEVLSTVAAQPRVSEAAVRGMLGSVYVASNETNFCSRDSQPEPVVRGDLQSHSADGDHHVSTRCWANLAAASASAVDVYNRAQPRSVGENTVMTSRDSHQQSGIPQPGQSERASRAWADTVASTPVVLRNRYAALTTDDDDDDQRLGFTEQRSRRSVKRQRNYTSEQQQQQQQQQNQGTRRRGRVVLTGKSTSNDPRLAAAKIITKKAVFCVDNVDVSRDTDDIRRFVNSLNVQVISCFPVRPRRRRNETGPVTDRKAFRLCINDGDQDRLLDDTK